VACHTTKSFLAGTSKKAPRLSTIGRRANPYYLERFIETPHATKPGTTMPDTLSHLNPDNRRQVAKSIVHFLLSLSKSADFKLEAIDTVAVEQGQALFHSVGCAACHSPRNAKGEEQLKSTSVPLGALDKKYSVSSLTEFLAAPHRVRPSGRMPDMRLPRRDAQRIAHYLLRDTKVPGRLNYTILRGRVWEGIDVNVDKFRAGHVNNFNLLALGGFPRNSAIIYEGFLRMDVVGQYTFFLEMNGGQLMINGAEVANLKPSARRGVKKIVAKSKLRAGWNHLKLAYIHTGKKPKLSFEMMGPRLHRHAIATSRLSISQTPIKPYAPYRLDAALVKQGEQAFVAHGCVKCHDDVKSDVKLTAGKYTSLGTLDVSKGCLSDAKGNRPRFAWTASQKALVRAALPDVEATKLAPRAEINKSLVTFNCIACHERTGLGGVMPERNHLFTGTKKELGNQGRIPPPLTLVGAKLKKQWIAEVMLRGKRQRSYMATTMPQFGEQNVGHLVDLFGKVDAIEQITFEKIKDPGPYKRAGHELIGTTGFSCIACHDFKGQKAAGPGAMEMIHTTERLKKDWFYLFMLNPARFRPNIIMPSAWPEGHVFKKDILGGDAKKQIESLWVYLEDGRRAKNPKGLSRKSSELRVADEAVICRGRGNAGYRGMAVGYPERISLAFDTQEMNLRLLWKGDFATVNHGSFSARGRDRIPFPQGIPFHRLKSIEDNWPYKRKTDYLFPQDHGYQFRGYYLDKKRRPTFMYRYGDIKVEDFFEDRLDKESIAYFRRTLTFESPRAQKKFFFRAASGSKITKKSATSFVVDRLSITYDGAGHAVVRKGEPTELLIPCTLPQGKSVLTLNYTW